MGKNYSAFASILVLIAVIIPPAFIQANREKNYVVISYEILSKRNDRNMITLYLKLKAQNMNTFTIRNVMIKILNTDGANINSSTFYFREINPQGAVVSNEVLKIFFDYSIQETPNIIWKIEYDNEDGNRIIETFSKK